MPRVRRPSTRSAARDRSAEAVAAPHFAILCYAAIAISLAVSGSFAELAALATLSVAVVYILGCASAWRLARRGVALAGEPLNFKWLSYAMVIGIASMLLLIALGSQGEIIGLLALMAISAATYLIARRRKAAALVATR